MDAVLITGAAGFIGFHVARRFLESGCRVVGFDDLNPYYDVALKRARISEIASAHGFSFLEADIRGCGGARPGLRGPPASTP